MTMAARRTALIVMLALLRERHVARIMAEASQSKSAPAGDAEADLVGA